MVDVTFLSLLLVLDLDDVILEDLELYKVMTLEEDGNKNFIV